MQSIHADAHIFYLILNPRAYNTELDLLMALSVIHAVKIMPNMVHSTVSLINLQVTFWRSGQFFDLCQLLSTC